MPSYDEIILVIQLLLSKWSEAVALFDNHDIAVTPFHEFLP